ncbi:TIGR00730 family Rossman fold protein [Companilactobacillus metriopterae]|uniref:LOG family protein n=1 Tax=Companilactobacillus metriopterae TaxID=1909267 RepID=UPI00100A7555|nr:TIGR00730 family Rossman fold protein [Companilactobacillus metriopterae]
MKSIAVYCGSSIGNNQKYVDLATELGEWMVKNGYGLTYGGGNAGLMGVVSRSVMASGGYAHGIITQNLSNVELANSKISQLDIVDNMDIRKYMMMKDSMASIALPGGPGTLEEISQTFSWAIIGEDSRPSIFYNIDGYYDHLKHFYDQMVTDGFLKQSDRDSILFSESLDEIGEYIENYKPIRNSHY